MFGQIDTVCLSVVVPPLPHAGELLPFLQLSHWEINSSSCSDPRSSAFGHLFESILHIFLALALVLLTLGVGALTVIVVWARALACVLFEMFPPHYVYTGQESYHEDPVSREFTLFNW